MKYKMLDGNGAAVEAIRLARVKVICAYPITPQSKIAEGLAEKTSSGEINAQYMLSESEHSAMSIVNSAQMTGVRAATATASNGLSLMHEVLMMTSGNRLPIVMPVVNRSVAAPWSLWCDHSDAMLQRDTGWIQLYSRNVQDVLDLMVAAYKIAEDPSVLLPAMVCLDGFFVSHSMQKVEMPDQDAVDTFIGPYSPCNTYLDPKDPMFLCDLTPSSEFTEIKYQQCMALEKAAEVADKVFAQYEKTFGRKLSRVESYRCDDADAILIMMGSMRGTAQCVVDKLREEGLRVGVAAVVLYRPFPEDEIRRIVKNAKIAATFDRNYCFKPLWHDVVSSTIGMDLPVRSYIGGLAGRDVSEATLEKLFRELSNAANHGDSEYTQWIDVSPNAMNIREVETKCTEC